MAVQEKVCCPSHKNRRRFNRDKPSKLISKLGRFNRGRREKYLCFRSTGRVNFFESHPPGKQILKKKLFLLSSLQTSLGLPVINHESCHKPIHQQIAHFLKKEVFFLKKGAIC